MEILEFIQQDKYFIADDNSVICTNNQMSITIDVGGYYPEIVQSLDVTKEMINDACFMSVSQFTKKYSDKVKPNNPLSSKMVFHSLRDLIVDEKMPVYKRKKKSKKTKSIREKKPTYVVVDDPSGQKPMTRKEQVNYYLQLGIESATEIANLIGSNPSYVSQLIKKING